jgi:hypothetical protein
MSRLTPAQAGRRRQKVEASYEAIIVKMARAIVNDKTTPERRARCQERLLSACSMISAYHSLSASALYRGAIRRAQQGAEQEGGNRDDGTKDG